MSRKRRKKGTKQKNTSSLKEHRRVRKVLQPPLAQLPVTPLGWVTDLLPDMLWIDSILDNRTLGQAAGLFHSALDVLDEFVPTDSSSVLTGLISSFQLVPADKHPEAINALRSAKLYEHILPEGLKHGLSLYSQCPMLWMLSEWRQNTHVDFEVGVRYLKEVVVRLFASRSKHSTRCRMFALARMIKHGKILFAKDASEAVELLPKYSDSMPEEQQKKVESIARALFASFYGSEDLRTSRWVPYFWRHNYEISACEIRMEEPVTARDLTQNELYQLDNALMKLKSTYREASLKAKLDLYDLDRDEVLFGLTSRQFRLFSAIASDPQLWTPDLGFMLHRVMADTLIVISWLVHKGDLSLYQRFKRHSVGKQKLYKLHLAEIGEQTGLDTEELEESLAERINEELWEELLPIELGAVFEGTNSRKMAKEVGLEHLYNLVYSPASAELHGEWTSLKEYHLQRCANPLHRFHWLPRFQIDNLLSPGIVLTASSMLGDTIIVWLQAYNLETEYRSAIDAFKDDVAGIFLQD